jgi:hypothetical protein
MRDHHHYTLYRDTNDGEGPLQFDISYNGIYKDDDDLMDESEDQEDIKEDSKTEGDPFVDNLKLELENDLIYKSDDQEDDPTDESEDQEDIEEDSETEGDSFVDELELEVENYWT